MWLFVDFGCCYFDAFCHCFFVIIECDIISLGNSHCEASQRD